MAVSGSYLIAFAFLVSFFEGGSMGSVERKGRNMLVMAQREAGKTHRLFSTSSWENSSPNTFASR